MKLHLSMQVKNFDEAVGFYSALFDQEPTVTRDNYAKWNVENPNVNFVVESLGNDERVDHLGIQVETKDELVGLAKRLEATGFPFLDIEKGTCCYASLEKSWVKGPTGEKWEAFLTHSHEETEYGEDREHLLDLM